MPIASAAPHVLIVGGGLAGAAVALRLLKDWQGPLQLSIAEPRAELGLGLAYSTPHSEHLVNGLAKAFSLYDDDAGHLVRWLEAQAAAGGWQPPPGTSFDDSMPPRSLYGRYVRATLQAAQQAAGGRVRLVHLRDRVVDLAPGTAVDGPRWQATLAGGDHVAADHVVLATGIYTRPIEQQGFTVDPALRASPRYVDDIWAPGAWDAIGREGHVVLLGAGLSALDSLIMAEKQGFGGHYTVLSRRGLPVQAREDVPPVPEFLQYDPAQPSLRALLAQVRVQRRALAAAGESWQRLILAIRPHVPALWAAAGERERRRFLGRVRSHWEAALHRSAPQPLAWQARVAAEGRFAHLAARVEAIEVQADGRIALHTRARADGEGGRRTLVADTLVNCLGFEFDWRRIGDPLVRQLRARGLVRPDALGFGIEATRDTHAVRDAQGRPQAGLYTLGHALRGLIWESNAIGEQVPQAGTVGRAIVAAFTADVAGQTHAAEQRLAA